MIIPRTGEIERNRARLHITFRAEQSIERQSLPTGCWYHVHLSAERDEPSFIQQGLRPLTMMPLTPVYMPTFD